VRRYFCTGADPADDALIVVGVHVFDIIVVCKQVHTYVKRKEHRSG